MRVRIPSGPALLFAAGVLFLPALLSSAWADSETPELDECLEEFEEPTEMQVLACAEDIYEFSQTRTCMPSGINGCDAGETPRPVQWARTPVEYKINEDGSQKIYPGDLELSDKALDSVFASFDVWNLPECSDFEMNFDGQTSKSSAGYDQDLPSTENTNAVIWQDDQWPHAFGNAVALTTVTFRPSNGQILGADIEVNTADFAFSDTENGETDSNDFRNTLTHEVGHFLGLDHSSNPSATMYSTAGPSETNKRELHNSDISGLCFIYPEGESYELPGSTEDPADSSDDDDGGWCSAAAGGSDPTLPGLALFLLAIAFIRRRSAG